MLGATTIRLYTRCDGELRYTHRALLGTVRHEWAHGEAVIAPHPAGQRLADLYAVFTQHNTDRLATKDLLVDLWEIVDGPWLEGPCARRPWERAGKSAPNYTVAVVNRPGVDRLYYAWGISG